MGVEQGVKAAGGSAGAPGIQGGVLREGLGFAVRLAEDMTRYHPALQWGADGWADQLPSGRRKARESRFVSCRFPGLPGTVDVLLPDLEVTDERVVRLLAEERASLEEAVKAQLARAVLHEDAGGGFRLLVLTYEGGRARDRLDRLSDARWAIAEAERQGKLARSRPRGGTER